LFALGALRLDLGTAFQMGPGYFPLVLALIMAGLGLVVMFGAFRTAPSSERMTFALRGPVIVTTTLMMFGLVVRGLGLLPAIAATTLLASYASRHASLPRGLLLTVGLTAFCVGVFHYGLGLPIPLFGNWL